MSDFNITNEMKFLDEFEFLNKPIITRTDKEVNIIFANSLFSKMSGFSRAEYLGRPHNIVRHPDMPKEIFEQLWHMILIGKAWNGYIKNRTKCGKFYWVEAFFNLNMKTELLRDLLLCKEEFLLKSLDVTKKFIKK